ncbi:MAG: DUF2510 domain-containing protein [Acidimicrobiales bacterium]
MLAALHTAVFAYLLYLFAFVLSIVVIADMARRPSWAWQRIGSNRALWISLLVVFTLFLVPIAVVACILYFAVTRPKLEAAERHGAAGGHGYGTPLGATPPPDAGWPAPGSPWAAPGASPWAVGVDPVPGSSATAPYPGAGVEPPTPHDMPTFGWYADPSSRHELRYWDGTRWTDHVSDGGQQTSDPLPG